MNLSDEVQLIAPALASAVAVPKPIVGIDGEARAAIRVKWTACLPFTSRTLEVQRIRRDCRHRDRFADAATRFEYPRCHAARPFTPIESRRNRLAPARRDLSSSILGDVSFCPGFAARTELSGRSFSKAT